MIGSWHKARRKRGRRVVTLILCAAGVHLSGCSEEVPHEVPLVEGWPPAAPLQSERRQARVSEADNRSRAKRVKSPQKAEADEVQSTSCQRLVERACTLLGMFSQECIEARSQAKSISKPSDLLECEQIIATFELTHAKDTRRNPCWVLARRVCEDRGRETKECKDRQASVKQLTRTADKQACRGDLLLEEARGVLRPNRK